MRDLENLHLEIIFKNWANSYVGLTQLYFIVKYLVYLFLFHS